jgi:hypothetical protein
VEFGGECVNECGEKFHIVRIRFRVAMAAVPCVVLRIWIGDDEAVAVRELLEDAAGASLDARAVAFEAVENEEQCGAG